MRRLWYGLLGLAVFGAVGVYSALTAHASRGVDVIPSIVATGTAMIVLMVLREAAVGENASAEMPDRRQFLLGASAALGLTFVAGLGGRALQHARYDVAKVRAAVVLPTAAPAPVAPGVDLGKSGVPWATPSSDFYRIDTALAIPQIDPDHWSLRIHGLVDKEISLTYQGPSGSSADRTMDHAGLRLERGRRRPDQQCAVPGHPARRRPARSRHPGRRGPARHALLGRHDDRGSGSGCDGRPRCPVGRRHERRAVARRPRLPGAGRGPGSVRLRVGLQVGRGHRGQHVREVRRVLGRPGLDPAGSGAVGVADRHAPLRAAACRSGRAWPSPESPGSSTSASRRSRFRSTAAPGRRPPWPPEDSIDTWRQWYLPWTPTRAGSISVRVRAVDANGRRQEDTGRDPFPGPSSGYHAISVTVHK